MNECLKTPWFHFSFAFGTENGSSMTQWLTIMAHNERAKEQKTHYRILVTGPEDVFGSTPAYDDERKKLWTVIEATPYLDWLLLTAHPDQAMAQMPRSGYWRTKWSMLPANVWVGAIIDGPGTRSRLTDLLRVPAQRRFLAYLPLRGPVPYPVAETYRKVEGDEEEEHEDLLMCKRCGAGVWETEELCIHCHSEYRLEWGVDEQIHWVIAGGDCGPEPQALDPAWLRELQREWLSYGVPFYFAQAGTVLARTWCCADPTGSVLAEMPVEFQVRELPEPWYFGHPAAF